MTAIIQSILRVLMALLIGAAIGLGALFLTHTAPFPFLLEAFKPRHSIWHMPRDRARPAIYLTFDDGPNPAATPQLLDVLARERVPATFFLIDKHLTPETAPIVRRMFDEGHGVALHSGTRALMFKTPGDLAATLTSAAERIERLAGGRPCPLFRPHAGWRSGPMYAGLQRIGYRLAGWSWGLWDWNWWRPREAADLARRLARRASAGDIVVMHDGHHVDPRPDRRYAVEATALLIPALRGRGLTFAALCQPQAAGANVTGPDWSPPRRPHAPVW
jgi:peptidoglycan/xylan/chitin deacetylase (PgdA/CDA1 family)